MGSSVGDVTKLYCRDPSQTPFISTTLLLAPPPRLLTTTPPPATTSLLHLLLRLLLLLLLLLLLAELQPKKLHLLLPILLLLCCCLCKHTPEMQLLKRGPQAVVCSAGLPQQASRSVRGGSGDYGLQCASGCCSGCGLRKDNT